MTPGEMVGLRVAAIRERQGLSQAQLGEELGRLLGKPWPRQTVSTAEKGGRAFTAAEIIALGIVLNTPLGMLLTPPMGFTGELEMPSGVVVEREELNLLGAYPGEPQAVVAAAQYRELSSSLRAILDQASALARSWLDQDAERSRELRDLYEATVAAYNVVEPRDAES